MGDYSNVIEGMFGSGPAANITANADVDPDKTARAYQLEQATGVPAGVISGDLDGFEAQNKAAMATKIAASNSYISDYVQSHPLAAKVSNDDYGNLDAISQKAGVLGRAQQILDLPRQTFNAAVGGAVKGFGEGFGEGGIGSYLSADEVQNHRLASSVISGLASPIEGALRLGSGVFRGTTEAVNAGLTQGYESATGDQQGAERFARDIAGAVEMKMQSGEALTPEHPLVGEAQQAAVNARDWIRGGETPPAGVHPLIDQAKLQQNQEHLDALDDLVKEAQTSTTKERAPDLFQGFMEQHLGKSQMGISGQRVLDLYGDKTPTPDDGLLGWVPNIAEQLEATKDTGADINVPLADWVTHVDPDVAKDLHDDLRVSQGGITNREAAEALPTVPSIAETVPQIRNASGLEPAFNIGDRKLQLQKMENGSPVEGLHDFDLVNETGQPVGSLNLSEQDGGKTLHVDFVQGAGDYYHPNNFGPALMRDLLRQIKEQFPNAESITGHRVSGARDRAGSYLQPSAHPKIALDSPRGWDYVDNTNEFRRILSDGWWHQATPGVSAYVKPDHLYDAKDQDIIKSVDDEIARIAPKGVEVQPAERLKAKAGGTAGGPKGEFEPSGLFAHYGDRLPVIYYALEHTDQLGTVRHEAIHHLYRSGFFKPEEWSTLEKASQEQGWVDRFNILDRYPTAPKALHLEESIAEAYKTWADGKLGDISPVIQSTFERLKDLFQRIKDHVGRILGKSNPTWEDLFEQVSRGEIGAREGVAPLDPNAFRSAAQIEEPGQGIDPQMPFRAAKDVGMTVDQYQKYSKLIRERQQSDLKASADRALKEQTKRQSKEWKDQSEALRPQVASDLNQRPDVAVDKFLGLGELFGEKLDKTYRLDYESLTPEQRASIPERYTVRRGGVSPDELAPVFGYSSGEQMLSHLSAFVKTREASGLNRDRFQRQMIDAETQRRMEAEHGFLDQNIISDARDQVLSQNQLDLLHEETHHLALMSGEKGFDLTQDQLVGQIKDKFDALPMSAVDSTKWLREAGKQGKMAELSLLSEKPADAFKAKQAQYYNTVYAKFAAEIEKQRKRLDKTAKLFKRSEVKNVDPEYMNHIQDLLHGAGYKIGRSLENVQENLNRRGQTLEQFADAKLADSFGYRNIPVADFILDGGLKPIDELTTDNFKALKQTIDALVKNARDEHKINREGEAADRADVLAEMVKHVEEFPLKPVNATATMWDKVKELPKTFIQSMTTVPTFLDRLGKRDPLSVFNRYVTYPLASAANRKSALQRQFGKAYQAIGEVKDKDKLVASPLTDPLSGKPFARFTRGNVAQMLQNAGNRSNWTVLAKGYGADPEALMHWLVANTTKEDWGRAQKLGKDVFGELIKLADQEYEHLNGITIDKIPLEPISNAHGTFEGWYHPLVKDPIREGKSPIREGVYDDSDYGHLTTANGYTKKRSGAAYPLSLDPHMTPVRINQMIHDIAFRRAVLETQKLFKDPTLSNKITAHYGAEYNSRNMLMPYLRGIAGQESIPSKAAATANRISEFLRQNVISTYIGFNPFTALKHGPTALSMSVREVGAMPLLRAYQDLYSRSPDLTLSNSEFAMKWSEELQRRERHWQDTIFGAHGQIEGSKGVRENIIQAGSWLVAQSDMASAKPAWLAAYRNAQDDGLSHGESIDLADRAVRRAHGSTAITNQPSLVRGGGPLNNWLTSVYGFFGTAMQRRIELAHDINDTFKFVKDGQITDAGKKLPGIMADVMSYVIIPTLVEEWVTGLTTDDKRGLLEHLASASLLGLSSSVLYLRDIVHGLTTGDDIGVGLISSALHDVAKAGHDLSRKDAFTRQRFGKTVGDTLTVLGHGTGMAPKTLDNAVQFGIDLVNHHAHPHTLGDFVRGVLKGKTQPRKVK